MLVGPYCYDARVLLTLDKTRNLLMTYVKRNVRMDVRGSDVAVSKVVQYYTRIAAEYFQLSPSFVNHEGNILWIWPELSIYRIEITRTSMYQVMISLCMGTLLNFSLSLMPHIHPAIKP